jgi:hypothetical protein
VTQEVIGQLDGVLRAGDLGGVESAADVDEDLPVGGEATRFGVREPGRVRESLRDSLELVEPCEILGR